MHCFVQDVMSTFKSHRIVPKFSNIFPMLNVHRGDTDRQTQLESQGWKVQHLTFFHHYQGSIDFNTVNIHRTVGMYFLVSTANMGDIE